MVCKSKKDEFLAGVISGGHNLTVIFPWELTNNTRFINKNVMTNLAFAENREWLLLEISRHSGRPFVRSKSSSANQIVSYAPTCFIMRIFVSSLMCLFYK